jgi:hypothetical protein
LLAALIFWAPIAAAESIDAKVRQVGSTVEVSATLVSLDHGRVINSVTEGLEVQIIFEFRLYEKTGRLFGFLGDRLIDEKRVRRFGSMDYFADRFVVRDDEGRSAGFSGEEDFVRSLSHLPSCWLELQSISEVEDLYVMARARVDYVTLDPPLNIVNLFARAAVTTDWQRMQVGGMP